MFCAMTKEGMSKFDNRRETVFATFLKTPAGDMMYIHTAPNLGHRACNITLADIDYNTVAEQLNQAANGVVTRGNFAYATLAVWSKVMELKSLEKLEGTAPGLWASERSDGSSTKNSSSDDSLNDTPPDSGISMGNTSSDSDSSSDNEDPSADGANKNVNSASGFIPGYEPDDDISDSPADYDSSSDNDSSWSSCLNHDPMNAPNDVDDHRTINTSYTKCVIMSPSSASDTSPTSSPSTENLLRK
jgi:hypothetical protein